MPIIRKKCKACGHVVMVERVMKSLDKAGVTPAPKDCASCRTLGVEKAIEQRLMASRKGHKTDFKIKDSGKQLRKEREPKTK